MDQKNLRKKQAAGGAHANADAAKPAVDLEKLRQRAGSAAARTGGKGSARRKNKKPAAHKTTSTADDTKLYTALRKVGVRAVPGLEEVRIYKNDGEVIQFVNPKVEASTPAKTWVVGGSTQKKHLRDFASNVNELVDHLGIDKLRAFAEISGPAQTRDAGGGAADDPAAEEG